MYKLRDSPILVSHDLSPSLLMIQSPEIFIVHLFIVAFETKSSHKVFYVAWAHLELTENGRPLSP